MSNATSQYISVSSAHSGEICKDHIAKGERKQKQFSEESEHIGEVQHRHPYNAQEETK